MRVRRGDLRDVYVEGDRSAVMVDETVVVLSELATAILEVVPADDWTQVEQITAAVVSIFGEPDPPESAADLTLANLHELIGHRILVTDDAAAATVASTPASVDALRSALRHLRSNAPSAWRLPHGVTADEFLAAAHQHQVVSFLDTHRDRLALPPGAAASLHSTSAQRAAAVEILAGELATALDVLDRADVRALAIKGLALAVQAHGDLAARGAGDLDLLVAPADVERAHAALTSAGWSGDPRFPVPGRSWAWKHLHRTGYETSLVGGPSTIDLHWHLAPSHTTFPPFATLWDRRSTVQVGGRAVPTLSAYDALAHSAGHAAKDQWPWLRSLVDVHLLVADPQAWQGVDRPLRRDQLVTVGLAARMFGIPTGAPAVVAESVGLTHAIWDDVLTRQVLTASAHVANPILGDTLRKNARTLRRTAAGPRDTVRQLGFSLLPPWLTVTEQSHHAVVAVPRLLCRRARGVSARHRA